MALPFIPANLEPNIQQTEYLSMPSDQEFLRQRLALLQEQLAQPAQEFTYAGEERVQRRQQPASRRDTRAHREARLLRKLLVQAREGQVLAALKGWRRQLGQFLLEHRRRYQEMQDAYDAWWQLPVRQRDKTPQPPQPPPARFIDRSGAPWIVDDRFLAVLDDLVERLQKWMVEE